MTRWTDDELRELVTLWPMNSASQIAKRLHRRRSAICRKAERLCHEGLLPHNSAQDFDVNPPKRRPPELAQ
jgi:GcrA cell cycle regulator